MRRQNDRLAGELDDRYQIPQGIDAHLIDVRVAADGIGRNEDGVTVDWTLGRSLDPDIAVGAALVLDHDLLAQAARQKLPDDTGADVGRAARRKRDDDANGPVRPILALLLRRDG